MPDQELVTDLLARLEERGDLARYSSIHELMGVDHELREQLQASPELLKEVERSFVALRQLDRCFGRDESAQAIRWPNIPGYEIQGELGYGGMGAVFKARQVTLNRTVAVKVVSAGGMRRRSIARRVRIEAETVARLKHPNIVQVHETGEWEGMSYIVLEYLAGGNLAKRLGGMPQPERWTAEMMRTITSAVSYAHEHGTVHRDLKPSNILIAADGTLKVADFGLAKLVDNTADLTRSGEILGTPNYMAPEQTRGRVSPQIDIYALGAILYESLTGRPPFSAETTAETLVQVQTREPIAPRLIRPRLDCDLEAICLKCLEKEPQRRYATAKDLAVDLARFLSGEPTVVRPLSGIQRAVRWSRRNRRTAALLGTIVALLVCISVVSTIAAVRVGRARDEARRTATLEHEAREVADRALAAEKASLEKALVAEQSALEARETAELQAKKADEVSKFLAELFLTADPFGTGRLGFRRGEEIGTNLTLRELLDRGTRKAQGALKDQPGVRATLLDTLGKVYSDLGLVDQAEPLVREAYEFRLKHPEKEVDLATSLLNMGMLLQWKGEYAAAERLLRQALEIRTRLVGADSIAVTEVEFALGCTLIQTDRIGPHRELNRDVEFDKLMHHVLKIQRRELGNNHRDVGLTMTLLAMRLFQTGKQAEAERMLLSSVGVYMQQEGGKSLGHAVFGFQQAARYRQEGKFDQAEQRYKSCLDVMRSVLGSAHFLTLVVAADFGGLLRELGRMDEFERNGREIIEVARRAYPHGHPAMILAIDNWFPFIATQGKFDEAVALVETKIMLEEKFLEPSPDREAHSKLTIAGYRLAQGRLDEASRILEKSQAAIDRLDLQPGNPVRDMEFTWLRGALAGARGDMAENERMYRECILTAEQNAQPTQSMKIALADVIHSQRPFDPETEKLLPIPDISHPNVMSPSNPNAADLHLLYAKLLIDRGKLDEAEPFLKYVSDFVHHKTMPGSYGVGQADSLTGALLAAKGKASDAEPLLLAGLENLRSSRGDHHRLTHEARDRLVNFYRRTGRDEEADQYTEILKVDASLPVAK